MSLTLLMTSDVLDVHYDECNAWLYLDWKGSQEVALVQAACQQVSAFIRQTGAQKILNDNTHVTQTSWDLAKWVAYDYLPQAAQAGLDYVAWVYSPLLGCRSNLAIMDSFSERMPQVAIFGDMAGACEWLSSVSVPALREALPVG